MAQIFSALPQERSVLPCWRHTIFVKVMMVLVYYGTTSLVDVVSFNKLLLKQLVLSNEFTV